MMQLHPPNTLERIEPAGGVAGSQADTQPASTHLWDFLTPKRDELLALLKPASDRKRTMILVAGALVAGFGLGWACGPIVAALTPCAQTETRSLRTADPRSGSKIDGARKTASTSALQAPSNVGSISAAGATPSAKPPGGTRYRGRVARLYRHRRGADVQRDGTEGVREPYPHRVAAGAQEHHVAYRLVV